MKKLYNNIAFFTMITSFLVTGCTNDEPSPLERDKTPPGILTNLEAHPLPGAIAVTYTLPSDNDLLYVIGNYTNKKGDKAEFRSSYYINYLMFEGFGDMDEYELELYTIDRSENRSQPVTIKAKPDTPPILSTYNTLEMREDFGGMNFTFENINADEYAIDIFTPDTLGQMSLVETFYTSRIQGSFSVRGYKDEPRLFGIALRDKWGNMTDTLINELTPIYEKELDKSLFREVKLPGDSDDTAYGNKLEYIWDGRISADSDGMAGAHTGTDTKTGPTHFTFDLGVLAKLSRFKLYAVQDEKHYYNDVSPRFYEVWGCAELDPSGKWDNWIKLLDIENVKPSGYPTGMLSNEDIEAAKLGDEGYIPLDAPKVRYIRIKCLRNWSNNYNMTFTEVFFYGNDKDEIDEVTNP